MNPVFDRYLFRDAPKPTKTLLTLYFLTVIVSVFVSLVKRKSLKITTLAVGFIFLLPLLYNTSCLIYGGCEIWAWLSIVTVIIVMILNIMSILQSEEDFESCDSCFT